MKFVGVPALFGHMVMKLSKLPHMAMILVILKLPHMLMALLKSSSTMLLTSLGHQLRVALLILCFFIINSLHFLQFIFDSTRLSPYGPGIILAKNDLPLR